MIINFILDGKAIKEDIDPCLRLVDYLKLCNHDGARYGCGEGECGACSVLLNGESALSCLVLMGSLEGKNVLSIEGFKNTSQYKIIEKCFLKANAIQCGYCTPGMVMATFALLLKKPHPTKNEIQVGLSGNLCRCTGYEAIRKAVMLAGEENIQWTLNF